MNVNVVSVLFFHIMDLSFLLGACCFGLFLTVCFLRFTPVQKRSKKLYKLFFFFGFVLCCVEYGIKCCQHGVVRIDC